MDITSGAVFTFFGVSLAQVQEILGIVILVVEVVYFLIVGCFKLYLHFKNKDVQQIDETLKDTIDGLEDIKDQIENKDKDDGNTK